MAPELLNPGGYDRSNSNPTKQSDIYAFGMTTYHVSATGRISTTVINGSVQVLTRNEPFPNQKDGAIIYHVIEGKRPPGPTDPNGGLSDDAKRWLSDDVWTSISLCWSGKLKSRPGVNEVIEALEKAVEKDRNKSGTSGSKPSLFKRAKDKFRKQKNAPAS